MSWLTDPRAFNWLIVCMFLMAAIRWAFAGGWLQVSYWLASSALVVSVTLMGGK